MNKMDSINDESMFLIILNAEEETNSEQERSLTTNIEMCDAIDFQTLFDNAIEEVLDLNPDTIESNENTDIKNTICSKIFQTANTAIYIIRPKTLVIDLIKSSSVNLLYDLANKKVKIKNMICKFLNAYVDHQDTIRKYKIKVGIHDVNDLLKLCNNRKKD